jgi:hypothetical protein
VVEHSPCKLNDKGSSPGTWTTTGTMIERRLRKCMKFFAIGSSIVVEHSPQNLNDKGSSPGTWTVVGTMRERGEGKKKIENFQFVAVSQW